MKVALVSLGCKLNQSETEALARRLALAGHQVVPPEEQAELCVVNSCAVTQVAARKSRQALHRFRRANPGATIVMAGCYAELAPQEIRALGVADMVLSQEDKERLPHILAAALPRNGVDGSALPYKALRTRAFVKIQDGCDNTCTYCVVALARGRARSRPPEEILAEIEDLAASGCKEVVLTGVHLGAYGQEKEAPFPMDLRGLIQEILARTVIPRLRLSSLEPWDIGPDFFHLWQDERLCPHLHLPLESGSDAVLRRMGRRYTAPDFARLVEAARAAIPDLALTTDVMVGFPGESDADFAESLHFAETMGFARMHIFPYSPRPGTLAAHMPGQVPPAIKAQRAEVMAEVARESEARFRRGFLGRELEVLWEGQGPIWSGYTSNYLPVLTHSDRELANTITRTRLVGGASGKIWGQVVEEVS